MTTYINASAPVPLSGPRSKGLNIILNDIKGFPPSQFGPHRNTSKVEVGTRNSDHDIGEIIYPTSVLVRKERDSLASDFISPFGVSLSMSVVNAQPQPEEVILEHVDMVEVDLLDRVTEVVGVTEQHATWCHGTGR